MAAVNLCHDYFIWPTGEYHKSLSKRLPTLVIFSSQFLTVCVLFKFTLQEINYLRSFRLLKMKGDFLE